MGGRIVQPFCLIVGTGNDLVITYNHGTYGYFSLGSSSTRFPPVPVS